LGVNQKTATWRSFDSDKNEEAYVASIASIASLISFVAVSGRPASMFITLGMRSPITPMATQSRPAIDAALGASPTVDQRGQPRPFGAVSDIGAFEVNEGDFSARELQVTRRAGCIVY